MPTHLGGLQEVWSPVNTLDSACQVNSYSATAASPCDQRRKAPSVKGTRGLTCAREGIRTPNLLIRSFPLRLPKCISTVLVLRFFVSIERKSIPIGSHYVSRYLHG